jgi:ferredoxin
MPKPHAKNAAGPFYVDEEMCVACGCCEDAAPQLFAFEELCAYVARQPANPNELEQMLEASGSCMTSCIRYGGSDPDVLRRLAENELASACDQPPPANALPINRTHVAFRSSNWKTAQEVASDFGAYLEHQERDLRVKIGPADVSYAWYEDHFHTVSISAVEGRTGIWLARHRRSGDVGRAVSRHLQDWLLASPQASDSTWFTERQWQEGGQGQDRPY